MTHAAPRPWRVAWRAVRLFDPLRSIRAKMGLLMVAGVLLSSLMVVLAIRSDEQIRVFMVISLLVSLALMLLLAHGVAGPLREMTAAALLMSRGDYSRRVHVRTRDEVGELAVAFNRMAADLEAVDRHRRELVANVSHELRTPISALRALLENIVDGVSAADPETMQVALEQTERLGRLVSQLLDLSRLDNGVVPLDARSFQVQPFLVGVLRAAEVNAGALRPDVRMELAVVPPELAAVADRERLHQVVANLLDNACRHSPPHGRVLVSAEPGAGAQSLVLEVQDEGPGIPEEERHRVFERFNRGTATSSQQTQGSDGGTGLGLAIARWAVNLHGGEIAVAESPRGCRIRVMLPGRRP
jgi:signal transduction histidine kinase